MHGLGGGSNSAAGVGVLLVYVGKARPSSGSMSKEVSKVVSRERMLVDVDGSVRGGVKSL